MQQGLCSSEFGTGVLKQWESTCFQTFGSPSEDNHIL